MNNKKNYTRRRSTRFSKIKLWFKEMHEDIKDIAKDTFEITKTIACGIWSFIKMCYRSIKKLFKLLIYILK